MGARQGARANRRRGEVEAEIDGERRILCLTLGALAELETALGADDLTGLAARFANGRLKAADLIRILGAGLRGGGHGFSDEEVAAVRIEGGVLRFAAIAGDLLAATFGGTGGDGSGGDGVKAGEAETSADPRQPQPAGGM